MSMRILIVDDHPVTRDGLRSALSITDEVEIVGEAASGEEAIDSVAIAVSPALRHLIEYLALRLRDLLGIG